MTEHLRPEMGPPSGVLQARFTAALDAFVPGAIIDGKYRVEGFLGAGAMAAVFRATDVLLERPVALKVLHAGDPELLRAEAVALARVRHDNVVQVYSFGVHASLWFMVMELIEGANLEDTIGHEGKIPPAAAIGILERIAAGLDAAHAQGVIHRDVKPANVLIGPRYRVCVSDFGLAGVGETISGTPQYMAPESFEGNVSAHGDQYALAVTAYQMLSGRLPFDSDELYDLLRQHTFEAPPPLGLPEAIEAVLHRGLAKTPGARWPSCASFTQALREVWSAELTSPSRTGPNVLIVDDDPAIIRLFAALVSDAVPNARVTSAGDGLVALEQMRASPPDLVTLDLQMPNLDGMELLHQLRAEPALTEAAPRILAISGLLGRERKTSRGLHVGVMLRALGVAEQLAKPVDPEVFVAAVKRQLGI